MKKIILICITLIDIIANAQSLKFYDKVRTNADSRDLTINKADVTDVYYSTIVSEGIIHKDTLAMFIDNFASIDTLIRDYFDLVNYLPVQPLHDIFDSEPRYILKTKDGEYEYSINMFGAYSNNDMPQITRKQIKSQGIRKKKHATEILPDSVQLIRIEVDPNTRIEIVTNTDCTRTYGCRNTDWIPFKIFNQLRYEKPFFLERKFKTTNKITYYEPTF